MQIVKVQEFLFNNLNIVANIKTDRGQRFGKRRGSHLRPIVC